jgi:hypothetical protein
MKQEYDIARNADWHRRGKMLDDMLAFLHTWWTTNPVSWDSEFFTLPPVHADLVVRQRAAAAGLPAVTLVDDHIPPRRGTVPSSALGPEGAEGVAVARAQRILYDQ